MKYLYIWFYEDRAVFVVLSAFDGGPLRIQTDKADVVILVMPQVKEKIPSIPEWLSDYATSGELIAVSR